MRSSANDLPGMDGVRGVACLAVFGVHWQQLTDFDLHWRGLHAATLLQNGNVGVAVFMILSGFLLTLGLCCPRNASAATCRNDRFGDGASIWRFWQRRGRRILPSYLLCLFPLAVLGGQWRSVGGWIDVGLHLVFAHNLSAGTLYSISPPFWALAPIVQFYGLFALVWWSLRYRRSATDWSFAVVFVLLAVVSQCWVWWMMTQPSSRFGKAWAGEQAVCLSHSVFIHLPIFVLGIVAALVHRRLPPRPLWGWDGVFLCGAISTLFALARWDVEQLGAFWGRYGFPMIPLGITAVVVSIPRTKVSKIVLTHRSIAWVGGVSYSFYLFHLPTMKVVERVDALWNAGVSETPLLFGVVGLCLSLVVSLVAESAMTRVFQHRRGLNTRPEAERT